MAFHDVLFEGETDSGHYLVTDCIYNGRAARVLYSGEHQAAQSGIAKDDLDDLLFDYNQRLMELVLCLQPPRVLVIGGAACTLPTAIKQELPDTFIDIVEPDPQLINIAENFFGFLPSSSMRTHITDGREFLSRTSERYDLIIVDAFVHTTIPQSLQTTEAFASYKNHLTPNGVVAFNVISSYHGPRSAQLNRLVAAAQSLGEVQLFPASHGLSLWLPQNFILVNFAGKPTPLDAHLRYSSIAVPSTSNDEALRDSDTD